MKGNRWEDHYTRRARQEQWRARSVYKLKEIDARFKILRKGSKVLDLGCHPGSWSQYCLSRVGAEGVVVGIDLVPVNKMPAGNFHFIQADINEIDETLLTDFMPRADVVLSDMAPGTTGSRVTDSARSFALGGKALETAEKMLNNGGVFVCKLLEGESVRDFVSKMGTRFRDVRIYRPKATRKRSSEVYVVGRSFTGGF
ncbi:MAG TPA: RlmE family RNA methyltransferase [Desulfobacteraceae bacterium]|jgi:23S rRNA (uridine2552-2'-O)-methyltransferase|nr:RlmE family RNA methyltransferase [Desulfobacteraceae bacterium]